MRKTRIVLSGANTRDNNNEVNEMEIEQMCDSDEMVEGFEPEFYELRDFLDVKQLKIGHGMFNVNFVDVNSPELFIGEYNGNALYGLNNHAERKIVIRNCDPYDEQLNTLLHEILHSIEGMYSIDLGEDTVRRLGMALATLLVDNNLYILQEEYVDTDALESATKEKESDEIEEVEEEVKVEKEKDKEKKRKDRKDKKKDRKNKNKVNRVVFMRKTRHV